LAPTYILTALKKSTHSRPPTKKVYTPFVLYIFFLFSSCVLVYIFDNELNFLPLYKPLDYPGVHPPLFRPALIFIFFLEAPGKSTNVHFFYYFSSGNFFFGKSTNWYHGVKLLADRKRDTGGWERETHNIRYLTLSRKKKNNERNSRKTAPRNVRKFWPLGKKGYCYIATTNYITI
jgi:hypothetical protein